MITEKVIDILNILSEWKKVKPEENRREHLDFDCLNIVALLITLEDTFQVEFSISADYFYFGIHKPMEENKEDPWMKDIISLLNGKKETDKQRAYEILKLVFQ